jgi:hypothetical protein
MFRWYVQAALEYSPCLVEPIQLQAVCMRIRPDVQDKTIGKKVYKITGNVLAANYVQMPRLKSQTLGLTGRYAYVQARRGGAGSGVSDRVLPLRP